MVITNYGGVVWLTAQWRDEFRIEFDIKMNQLCYFEISQVKNNDRVPTYISRYLQN